jgi:hypothetical protein
MGEGLQEKLCNLQRAFSPTTSTYNSKEEEVEPRDSQLVELKQSINFSLELVQEGLFEVFKPIPSIILVDVPTKAHSKCMMRHKRKEVMEDNGSPTKVTWKQAPIEGKEIQKMLQLNLDGIQ